MFRKRADRQTDEDAAQHKAGCCHGSVPPWLRGENTPFLFWFFNPKSCLPWGRGTRLQQLPLARVMMMMVGKGARRSPHVQVWLSRSPHQGQGHPMVAGPGLWGPMGTFSSPRLGGLLPSPAHSQRCLKKQDTRALCVFFFFH